VELGEKLADAPCGATTRDGCLTVAGITAATIVGAKPLATDAWVVCGIAGGGAVVGIVGIGAAVAAGGGAEFGMVGTGVGTGFGCWSTAVAVNAGAGGATEPDVTGR
jgi:hypothetical protein